MTIETKLVCKLKSTKCLNADIVHPISKLSLQKCNHDTLHKSSNTVNWYHQLINSKIKHIFNHFCSSHEANEWMVSFYLIVYVICHA